jgi:hypothetical protein
MAAKSTGAREMTTTFNQYLTRAEDLPDYVKVPSKELGDARPAFLLLLVVLQLLWPEVFIEVEVVATRA